MGVVVVTGCSTGIGLGAFGAVDDPDPVGDGRRVVLIEPGSHRTNVEANLPPVDVTSPYADLAARTCQLTVDGVRSGDGWDDAIRGIFGDDVPVR